MKSARLPIIAILTMSFSSLFGQSDFYEKRWSSVYRYEVNNLPKSAAAVVDTIYKRARLEKNITQFTKSLMFLSKFGLTLEEDAELHIVQKLQQEIAVNKAPLKNILESILANLYWQYFVEHRYIYYQRSRTKQVVNPKDFRTWDASAMFLEMHRHFQNSVVDAELLQKIKIGTINEILIQAENSPQFRPTVFDLIAHNAIDFYKTNEMTLTQAVPDSISTSRHALELLDKLLSFHKTMKDTSAIVVLEIEKLNFISAGSQKKLDALAKFKSDYRHHPTSTLLDFEMANLLNIGDELKTKQRYPRKEALEICMEAIAAFPKSDGANQCKILRENILRSELELTAEEYIPILAPSRLRIEYRNVDTLYLTAYSVAEGFEKKFQNSMNDSAKQEQLRTMTPEKSWQVTLKNLHDYETHSSEVVVPALQPGRHMIVSRISGSNKSFFAFAFIQVTNLVLLERGDEVIQRYQVVDRNTGKPVPNAEVHLRTIQQNSNGSLDERLTTNKDGFCEIRKHEDLDRFFEAMVTHEKDQAVFGNYYIYQTYGDEDKEEGYSARAFLFTDRSIYRPGQTVLFKGILIKIKGGKSSIVTGEYVEVFLEDARGEEAGKLRLKTNSYGSFSGEFKLPASGLTGEYSLYADEDPAGDTRFYDDLEDFDYEMLDIAVEEYKRPTFEATFIPVKETFKLMDTVTVKGTAMSFSGSKISKAKVRYHVKRNVRYPHWYYWQSRNHYSEAKEITFGETTTDANGEFTIKFAAIPDVSASKADKPVFHYEISVDVTDITGETRSANTVVKAGYHSMVATLNTSATLDKKVLEHTLSVTTENLNGQYAPAKGVITMYKLKSPDNTLRKRPWSSPDLPVLSEDEFKSIFPHDAYEDEDDPKNWKKGKLMTEVSFDTEKSKDVKFTVNRSWESGSYLMELTTTDPSGTTVTDMHRFTLFETGTKAVSDKQLFVFEMDKAEYTVGELARVKIGSASSDITITVDIERDSKIFKTYVEHLSGNTKEITIPVNEGMGNGFSVRAVAVNYNSPLYEERTAQIVPKAKRIDIETITFKDKLQPGGKETWSFQITGDESINKQAEVLASMYDASLDQFKPHHWSFDPEPREFYRSYYYGSRDNKSFGNRVFSVRNQSYALAIPHQYYDHLDWFGFSLTDNYAIKRQYLGRIYYTGSTGGKESTITVTNSKLVKEGFIYGTITTGDGELLPGVNVVVKGTTRGTTTDVEGQYTVQAKKGDELVYSFIGYKSVEAKVGRKNTIHVTLEEDMMALSEVVVTGYGVQQKKDITASVSVAFTEVSEGTGDVVFSKLEGKAAGVQITGESGDYRMQIRGSTSVDGSSQPLYVVDGVIVESSKIDQSDLADIQVLKGASATAIYGSRGSNGVIIVMTKSGQKKLDEEMAKVSARKNFNETAFFFPHLTTDETGKIRFTFTTPEALTRWKLQLLAHTKDLTVATSTLQTVTQKELMVTPNAPRFMRIGDEIIFSAKVSNLSGKAKEGKVALQLSNAVTGEPVDVQFKNAIRNQSFKVAAKGSTEVSWKLTIPAGVDAVQYKIVAKAGNFSDGEQNALPVLSNRMLVTETLPMYVRSGQTKTFTLEKLKTTTSPTLKHHQVTLEVTSNPAWYALQALPYLMEFPHECAEQLFSRYYSNALATHVVNSSPKIKEVFDQWSSSNALLSNLEKNQELKSLIIEESPWLRDAQNETEQKKRIALLFDLNTMKGHLQNTLAKLGGMQLHDGGFPWFSGGIHSSRFITQHVASGFGHLKQLNVLPSPETNAILKKAIEYLDDEIRDDYRSLTARANDIRTQAKTKAEGEGLARTFLEQRHTYENQVHYLYMRSFFADVPVDDELKTILEYYRSQSATYWKEFNLYLKGMVALIQYRNDNTALATAILRSLRETSIISDELGMYWKENKSGWYWYESPVETQALLIEAFAEIESTDATLSASEKQKTIDELRIWLLKNKQTTQWKTTKATTEAVYALLLNGTNWLSLDDQVQIMVGNKKIEPDTKQLEVGTGYFKTSWKETEVNSALSEVTLTKKENGIAWGGLYWQYFEDLDKITAAETPLQLTKKVFVVKRNNQGELLTEVNTTLPLSVGDLLRVRIELKVDREMEFLHMKDMRASGLEPVDVLSGYKWREGLGYYQSTRDAATNFFFDSVQKGVYVFEYDLRVNNKGNFANGITTIQSMYAPEFGSHSEGIQIVVD